MKNVTSESAPQQKVCSYEKGTTATKVRQTTEYTQDTNTNVLCSVSQHLFFLKVMAHMQFCLKTKPQKENLHIHDIYNPLG